MNMTNEGMVNNEQQNEPMADPKADWLNDLDKAVRPPGALAGISLPPRQPIIGNWFKQGDLGFIYGPRGLGKTWMGIFVARRCAEGAGSMGALPEWKIRASCRVLYVDGEMSMDEIRERDAALSSGPAPGLYYLQHEALFHLTGRVLNLTEAAAQAAILEKCRRERIDILVLDNISCLFPGLRENGADSWDQVLPWLLELRRNRIAVIFIAHAGRNGGMRGTSRREDAAFWIINLSEPKDVAEAEQGAKFVTRFEKNRNTIGTDCPSIEWTFFKPPGVAKVKVTWKKLTTAELFRRSIEEGLCGAEQIAARLGISKGHVSKLARKALDDGWLIKNGRNYALHPILAHESEEDSESESEVTATE